MAQKYTLASGVAGNDRLVNVGTCALQLSTGELVMLIEDQTQPDPNKIVLILVPSPHTTPQTIATLNTNNFSVNGGYSQSMALCRDASDNLYVIGRDNANIDKVGGQAFSKNAGLTWNAQTYGAMDQPASEGWTLAAFAATWCNTGGGDGSKGHILAICTETSTKTFYFVLDAGAMLEGDDTGSFILSGGITPAFLGATASGVLGSNIDIDNNGFGATTGLAVVANDTTHYTVGAWGVTSSGVLTTSTGLKDQQTTGTMSNITKLRIVNYATDRYAVLGRSSVNAAQLTCRSYSSTAVLGSVDTGVVGNFPGMGATLSWDVTTPPVTLGVFVYGWSSVTATTMMRQQITFTSAGVPSLGSTITDDTAVGSGVNTTIRAVKSPTAPLTTDWQTYNTTSPYSLLGDFSTVSGPPGSPVLGPPANNAVVILAPGGTINWQFNSPIFNDAQTAYYFQRQISGGAYEWWNGTAWQGTEIKVSSAAQSITWGAGFWTAAAIYSWTVATEGSLGLKSAYASALYLQVANPAPANPVLTASYDPVLDRTTLTLHSNDATGPTGSIEYSDDAGATWSFLRGATALTINPGTATLYDVEVNPIYARQYRARSWTSAPQSFSAYVTQTITSTLGAYYLKDPIDGTSIQVKIKAGTFKTWFNEDLTVHVLLGRADPVVVGDMVHREDGQCTFMTFNTVDEKAFVALMSRQRVLLLQSPEPNQFYIRRTNRVEVDRTVIDTATFYREHPVIWVGVSKP